MFYPHHRPGPIARFDMFLSRLEDKYRAWKLSRKQKRCKHETERVHLNNDHNRLYVCDSCHHQRVEQVTEIYTREAGSPWFSIEIYDAKSEKHLFNIGQYPDELTSLLKRKNYTLVSNPKLTKVA